MRSILPITAQLDYASPGARRQPWGPVLFRPGRLSILLALLAGLTAFWLFKRHVAWVPRLASPISQFGASQISFTPAGDLLVLGDRARVYDSKTGQKIREFGAAGGHWRPPLLLNQGAEILQFTTVDHQSYATLINTDTGIALKEFPLAREDVVGMDIVAVAPIGHHFVAKQTRNMVPLGKGVTGPATVVWNLDAPREADEPLRPVAILPHAGKEVILSPDGQRVAISQYASQAMFAVNEQRDGFVVCDLPSGKSIFIKGLQFSYATFTADSKGFVRSWYYPAFEIVDAGTGVSGAPIATSGQVQTYRNAPDSAHTALISAGPGGYELSLFDLTVGMELPSRTHVNDIAAATFGFSPDSRRLLAPGLHVFSLAIYDIPTLRPLAILRGPPLPVVNSAFSQDLSQIAMLSQNGAITILHRAGPDCPESVYGALAFPHLWLLVIFTIALAFSLRRDAIRSASELSLTTARFALILLIIALPRTLHALIALCIGERVLTPAPLLLLAAIGLATGAKFYRLGVMVLLAAALPLELYCLYLLKKSGLGNATSALLFDRTYEVPNMITLIALAFFTAMIPLGLYFLSRRQPTA